MGYLCTSWGTVITGSDSPVGGEYSFSSNGIWCGGVGVLNLALNLFCSVGADIMVNACDSTLGC